MEIKFNLTDKEVNLLAMLLKYQEIIEVEVTEIDAQNNTEIKFLEPKPNPLTKEQYVLDAFLAYKDKWIRAAVQEQVHLIAKQTEASLIDPAKLDLIVEAVKAGGIENLSTILKEQL